MLNIGIIGITEVLEPHVKRIQKNKNVNVIGKASVGTSEQLNGFHFSIPEFNRVELIERADVLLVDNSSLMPFNMLCDIVKKSKHIFATEYLNLTVDECTQLVKLANESGSVFQVSNPFYYTPAVQWLNNNISFPLFLDVSKFANNSNFHEILYPLFLMLEDITGIGSKKIGVTAFESSQNEISFSNIRLEFGDASVVNLNYGNQFSLDKFIIKGYSKDKYISLDFNKKIFLYNNSKIDFSNYLSINEFDSFIKSIEDGTSKSSNIENYQAAIQLVNSIEKKIKQFSA
jgi:hypothetical protein